MDLTEYLIGDCSPYIGNFIYDIDVRMVFIELLDDPESQNLRRRVVFPGVTSFAETNLLKQWDDEAIDDVVSIQRLDAKKLVITTYKKELLISLEEEPFVEDID